MAAGSSGRISDHGVNTIRCDPAQSSTPFRELRLVESQDAYANPRMQFTPRQVA